MPSSSTTVVFRGTVKELYEILNRLPSLARTAAPALRIRVAQALLGRIKQAFVIKARGGTDTAGERWKPLAPYTIAKRRQGKGKDFKTSDIEILRDTGLLLNSLTPGATAGDVPPVVPNQVFRLEEGCVIVGTRREWALDQHEGRPYRSPSDGSGRLQTAGPLAGGLIWQSRAGRG